MILRGVKMKLKSRLDKLKTSLRGGKEKIICIVNKCDNLMSISSLGYKGTIDEGLRKINSDDKNTIIIVSNIPRPQNGGELNAVG
jgi:hypothetical protein